MSDKNVTIKIVTEYDGSGADKAKADMAAMGKQSAGGGASPKATAKAAEDAIKTVEDAATTSATAVTEAVGATAASFVEATSQAEGLATAAPKAAAAVQGQAPKATASVGGLTKGFKFGRMAAAAFASTAGKAFAWIGLINQCIELLKTLWSWWNKADEEKQKKRAEEMERQAEAARAAKVAFDALAIKEADDRYLARRNTLATRYGRNLDAQLRTLRNMSEQEQIQLNLAALKLSNERDAEELRLNTQLAAGKITETQYNLAMLEVEQQRDRDSLTNQQEQWEQDLKKAEANAAFYGEAYDAALKESHKLQLGEGLYHSNHEYLADKAAMDTMEYGDPMREEIYRKQRETADFFAGLGIEFEGQIAQAFTELGSRQRDAETTAKSAAREANTANKARDAIVMKLEEEMPQKVQLLAEMHEKQYAAKLATEDVRLAEKKKTLDRDLQEQKAQRLGDDATRMQSKADDLAAGLGVGTNATKAAREAAATLLAALKDNPEMLKIMGQYAMGKGAQLTQTQRDMYGEQLGDLRRADVGTRKQVWAAANAQYSATRKGEDATRVQEDNQADARAQQRGDTTRARRDYATSHAEVLRRENAALLQQIEDLTQTMQEMLSTGAMTVDELARMKQEIASLRAEGRANNQQLKNLKRR